MSPGIKADLPPPEEYESPEPGIPTVLRVPRRPMFSVAPGLPNEALLKPLPVTFRRTPGTSRIDLR